MIFLLDLFFYGVAFIYAIVRGVRGMSVGFLTPIVMTLIIMTNVSSRLIGASIIICVIIDREYEKWWLAWSIKRIIITVSYVILLLSYIILIAVQIITSVSPQIIKILNLSELLVLIVLVVLTQIQYWGTYKNLIDGVIPYNGSFVSVTTHENGRAILSRRYLANMIILILLVIMLLETVSVLTSGVVITPTWQMFPFFNYGTGIVILVDIMLSCVCIQAIDYVITHDYDNSLLAPLQLAISISALLAISSITTALMTTSPYIYSSILSSSYGVIYCIYSMILYRLPTHYNIAIETTEDTIL